MTTNDSHKSRSVLESAFETGLSVLIMILIIGLTPALVLADMAGFLSSAPPADAMLINNFRSNQQEFKRLAREIIEIGVPLSIRLKSTTANYPFAEHSVELESFRVRMRHIRVEQISLSADRQCVSFVNYRKYYRRDIHTKSTDFCLRDQGDAVEAGNTDNYVGSHLSAMHDDRNINVRRKLSERWSLSYDVIR